MAYWRLSEIAYHAYNVIQKLNLYKRIRERVSMASQDKLELSLINSWQKKRKYMEAIYEYSKKNLKVTKSNVEYCSFCAPCITEV